jgi:pimeloyl-ACP methyl ester carboxylesterase
VAAWCALSRPDIFASVVLMSALFGGPPALPSNAADAVAAQGAAPDIHAALAALPRPRKHYQAHYSTRAANAEMLRCPQGVHAFLRAYYHMKSADWAPNQPFVLQGWCAEELAKMPEYYVMDRDKGMAETVAPHLAEFGRTGFQGGLRWYRCATHAPCVAELQSFAGRTIDVPACFIAGAADWGVYQKPGELQRMQQQACTQFRGVHLLPGAGHWVQQEQAAEAARRLLEFLGTTSGGSPPK